MPYHDNPVCRGDGWIIESEWLDGDFDVDPVLARALVGGVLASEAFSATTRDPGASWLHEYFHSGPSAAPGTLNRLYEEAQGAAVGPGGILGNLNTGVSAAHAVHAASLENQIQAGTRKITAGESKSVRINSHVTLYNGNTSGKGRPRPRIRIANMPLQAVQPTLGEHFRYSASTQNVTEALKAVKLKDLAPKLSPLARLYIRGGAGAAALTFGPSVVLDLIDSINRDTRGKLQFDAQHFAIASARSQSGNLAGYAGSAMFTASAVALFPTLMTGATVVVGVFVAGFFTQIVWNALGGPDYAESFVKEKLEK